MVARYVSKAITVECEDVMKVHPEFDIESAVWFTESGIVARSLRELQQKLPKATIVGYYPQGYGIVQHEPRKPGETSRSTLRTGYGSLNLSVASYRVPTKAKPVKEFEPAPLPKLSQEDARLERHKREYEKLNNIQPKPGRAPKSVSVSDAAKRKSGWTPEMDEALRKYVALGWYADQIAVTIGLGLTKNAVIGRCHRKGLQLEHKNGRLPKRKQ